MLEFKEVFQNKHVILPVIHVESVKQVVRNIDIAKDAGCDGVFLINMGGFRGNLLEVHKAVFGQFPDFWIGINRLGVSPLHTFDNLYPGIAGVWTDNAYIDERMEAQSAAETIEKARKQSDWKGLYFGGVAFKYQRPVADLVKAAQLARNYIEVITTSGEGTGYAPSVDKIRIMKAAIEDHPLAIASGISPENVRLFLPYADAFLVASSLLIPGTEDFNPDKVKSLLNTVRSY